MPLATTALSIGGAAAAVLLYLRYRRARSATPRQLSETPSERAVRAPARDSVVDLFLFEKSFGWEFARLLLAALPVAAGLLTVLWFIRSIP